MYWGWGLIHLTLLRLEVNAERTERFELLGFGWVVACVLLLGQFGCHLVDLGIAKAGCRRCCRPPCGLSQWIRRAAIAAVDVVTDGHFGAIQFAHKLERQGVHPCVGIAGAVVRN